MSSRFWLFAVCVGLSGSYPAQSFSQAASSDARACLQANYGPANAQTLARAVLLTNQCNRPVGVRFAWRGEVSGRGASAPCTGGQEEATLGPNTSHRTIETNCSRYEIEAFFAGPSASTNVNGDAASCIQKNPGPANSSTSARAILLRNQCERPVQVRFQWSGQVEGRPGASAPCSGPPEVFVLDRNGSHRSIETNCSSYSVEATYAGSANPRRENKPAAAVPLGSADAADRVECDKAALDVHRGGVLEDPARVSAAIQWMQQYCPGYLSKLAAQVAPSANRRNGRQAQQSFADSLRQSGPRDGSSQDIMGYESDPLGFALGIAGILVQNGIISQPLNTRTAAAPVAVSPQPARDSRPTYSPPPTRAGSCNDIDVVGGRRCR